MSITDLMSKLLPRPGSLEEERQMVRQLERQQSDRDAEIARLERTYPWARIDGRERA